MNQSCWVLWGNVFRTCCIIVAVAAIVSACGRTDDPSGTRGTVFHASPQGSLQADGSAARPFTLAEALDSVTSEIATVQLEPGVYPGPHIYPHEFTRASPLIVRSAPGQNAVLDGEFRRSGGGIRWQNIEFSAAGWRTRSTNLPGSNPDELPDLGFSVFSNDEFINCVVHDHSSNGFWKTSKDLLVYGCLFYNQGWEGPDRGHGPAAYVQNQAGTKHFRRNVFVKGFSRQTVQAYSSSRTPLEGFDFEENVSIGGRWLVGGESPLARLSMDGNHILGVTQVGYRTSVINEDATLINNVLSQEVTRFGTWIDFQETGTVHSDTLNQVYVYDNAFDPNRGLIVVYNAAQAASVDIDVTSLPLTAGRSYKLVNSLNPMEAHPFVFDSTAVSLPMIGWSVAAPIAMDTIVVDNPSPAFGAFLLMEADVTPTGVEMRSAAE